MITLKEKDLERLILKLDYCKFISYSGNKKHAREKLIFTNAGFHMQLVARNRKKYLINKTQGGGEFIINDYFK